ncbi:MAG: diguanylate cyclase [Candidatus Schekmanbacteria bacterium]|nr:diguanylate cyclase [Candidatus Schekmanbacteria bacterium]
MSEIHSPQIEVPQSKILLVDNDQRTLKLLKLRLENEGYSVSLAVDGQEGLVCFAQDRPELVMLDVNMPGMSGLTVLVKMKIKSPETPVIIMTAYGSEQVAVDAMKKGASDYLTKPFNTKEVCQVIKENIERSRIMISRNQLLEMLRSSSAELIGQISELERSNKELIDSIRTKSDILAKLETTNLKLKELSIRDGLTRLYNHVYFQERLNEEFTRSQRYNSALSFVMVDIDNFKEFNDRFGHQQGDSILVKVSQILMVSIRGIDFAARYGGEEFALILPNIDIKGAKLLSERLRNKVENYFSLEGEVDRPVTISQGVSGIPSGKIKNKTDLIKAADSALYKAKRQGKNRVMVAD